jgi:preprotein translocase subunit SecA
MPQLVNQDLWSVFDARRVKAPELKNLDHAVHAMVGWFKNRRPILGRLRRMVERIEKLESEIQNLGSTHFREAVEEVRVEARLGRLRGPILERAMALAREAAKRSVGMRPYPVQMMGALAMYFGNIAEMATGEGKTLTASLCASLWAWEGKPVHVITVNDYLVHRDATEMAPVYNMLGHRVGHVVHETPPQERFTQYRCNVVYMTSKELVADFLRDQIAMNNLRQVGKQIDSAFSRRPAIDKWHSTILDARTATQTSVGMLAVGQPLVQPLVPGLWRVLVDEADSLLIDEAVTPLIISNSPDDEPNKDLYVAAHELAGRLVLGRDFKLDRTVRHAELTPRGQETLDQIADGSGFWRGKRRREELVTQALTARYLFIRDEHYLINEEQKIQIIDEFTGRIMADRSWRHGLHQAIEVKEGVPVTADKENLAHLSFQRFFRQYPIMGGMTGTAWESAAELWQIYQRPVVRIPTNKPCIRVQHPTRMFDTEAEKYDAVIDRVCELNDKGVPVLVGTRSVLASEEISRRLTERGRKHRVLNAAQNKEEATIVAQAGQMGQITVATNMAGRGTDIKLGKGVAELGGLHVISTEPHSSSRVDRQLYGRAARQGDPGSAQLFCSAEDDLFVRHANKLRKMWRTIGADKLIRIAQARAEKLARFNRKQVLKNDDWLDQSMPF